MTKVHDEILQGHNADSEILSMFGIVSTIAKHRKGGEEWSEGQGLKAHAALTDHLSGISSLLTRQVTQV